MSGFDFDFSPLCFFLSFSPPSFIHPPSTMDANSTASHTCLVCGACFRTHRELLLHKSSHPRPLGTKGWTCYYDDCPGRQFRRERDYRGHLHARHNVHKCIDCALEFDSSQQLLHHMQSTRQHRPPLVFPVTDCGHLFIAGTSLL